MLPRNCGRCRKYKNPICSPCCGFLIGRQISDGHRQRCRKLQSHRSIPRMLPGSPGSPLFRMAAPRPVSCYRCGGFVSVCGLQKQQVYQNLRPGLLGTPHIPAPSRACGSAFQGAALSAEDLLLPGGRRRKRCMCSKKNCCQSQYQHPSSVTIYMCIATFDTLHIICCRISHIKCRISNNL